MLYLADQPQRDAIIDRGLFWNWAIPGFLFLGAIFVGWLTVAMLRGGSPQRA